MKVLVADDDFGSRIVAESVVRGLGHECLTAADRTGAWELIQSECPDVLISDRGMPGMDGLELCRRVRGHDGRYTYIVLLTSHAKPEDVLAGMLAGADDYLTKPLDPVALQARLLAAGRVTELHLELARARAELSLQARTDPLTGLRNRLSLNADLEDLHRVSARYGRSYAVALCDVDLFKHYNDRYGHPAGDRALVVVAATLVDQLRDVDMVYRYGGEEFLVLLPEQSVEGAVVAMERVRRRLELAGIEHLSGGPSGVLTLSVGVCGPQPGGRRTAEDVLAAADAVLYEAKAAGRNQVRSGSPLRNSGAVTD